MRIYKFFLVLLTLTILISGCSSDLKGAVTVKPSGKDNPVNLNIDLKSLQTSSKEFKDNCFGIEYNNGNIANFDYLKIIAGKELLQPVTVSDWYLKGCLNQSTAIDSDSSMATATELIKAFKNKFKSDYYEISDINLNISDKTNPYCKQYIQNNETCRLVEYLQKMDTELKMSVFESLVSHGCIKFDFRAK